MGYKGREHKGLFQTISEVRDSSQELETHFNEYKGLLNKVAESDFVKHMHDLRTNIK